MALPVVIDFETKYTFREYSDPRKLEISVAGAYDYATDTGIVFQEHELSGLFRLMESASYVIGFNIIDFDLPVLQPYYPGDVTHFRAFDLMSDIKDKLGRRLSLDSLIKATLGKGKTGHGLQAVEFFKQGKLRELSEYCLSDVMLTKELLEHGAAHNEIQYLSPTGKSPLRVSWGKYLEGEKEAPDLSLTLPF